MLWLVVIHNIFNAVAYPISGPFANGLRAAGDVKFTMYISLFSTLVVRVALSVLLGVWLHLGVIGIALAMAGTGASRRLSCCCATKAADGKPSVCWNEACISRAARLY